MMELANTEQEINEAVIAVCKLRGINPNAASKRNKTPYQINQSRMRDREEMLAEQGKLEPEWSVNICGAIGR